MNPVNFHEAISDTPQPIGIDQLRYAVKAGFGQKGAHMGGAPGLPELFDTDMLEFHRTVFAG